MDTDMDEYRTVLAAILRAPVRDCWGRDTRRRLIREEMAKVSRRLPAIDRTINERAEWRAHIDANTEGGLVAMVRAGMDCDCVKYRDVRIVPAPASIVAWLREYERHCEWLDGPESTWFDKPSNFPDGDEHESRDLVLEAFEDGHPHVVYA